MDSAQHYKRGVKQKTEIKDIPKTKKTEHFPEGEEFERKV